MSMNLETLNEQCYIMRDMVATRENFLRTQTDRDLSADGALELTQLNTVLFGAMQKGTEIYLAALETVAGDVALLDVVVSAALRGFSECRLEVLDTIGKKEDDLPDDLKL